MYVAFFILLLVAFLFEGWAMYTLMSIKDVPQGAYIGLAIAIILTGFLLGGVATEKLL